MTDERDADRHEFSTGQGVDVDYEEFTLDPEAVDADPTTVDPVDAHVLTDLLDRRNVEQDAVDVERLVDVGLSYMQINRFEEATETFERAARFADEESLDAQEAWVNKGAAHAELEEYDEAIGAYREALYVDDDSEHAATAETNLAYAPWESGQGEQALDEEESAIVPRLREPRVDLHGAFCVLERLFAPPRLPERVREVGFSSGSVLGVVVDVERLAIGADRLVVLL